GTVRLVMRGAEVPSWRPDGRQIGFVYGDWRWVDWAIDWDGGAVDVDTGGRPVGPLYPLITGYHEDFQPVWSPRGRWVAYHSHRAKTPVASYRAPGSSDDILLRRVGAPARAAGRRTGRRSCTPRSPGAGFSSSRSRPPAVRRSR